MKIDLSAVAIVLLFVAPGYLAYWTRNHFAPRSLAPKGPAEEFAGFVVVSACTHGLLGIVAIAFAALGGLELDLHPFGVHFDLFRVFAWADQFDLQGWLALHKGTALAILVIYFGLSCALGYLLGLPLALLDLNWHDSLWGWVRSGKLGNWMNRQGIRGTIGEQPAIYTALKPELDEYDRQKYVFVEAELRGSKGFYTGQVSDYSLSKDEDPHKLVLLRNTRYRSDDSTDYGPVTPGETVLIDLADVLILRIQQVPKG